MTTIRTLEEQAARDREACDGKVRHSNKARAKAAASIQQRGGKKIWIYACTSCRGFHLTSKNPTTRRWWTRRAKEL